MSNAPTITASPVENFTGSRLTRITYSAQITAADGTTKSCPHWGHTTPEAAIKCGRKIAAAA